MDTPDNANAAVQFLRMCAMGQVREAYARHVAADFIHHNPWFPGDRQSLLEAMEDSARQSPNKAFEPVQVIEGDGRVAVFSRLERAEGQTGYAVVHILRFQAGKVVEMWDVAQEIPAQSPNANGMF